MRIKEFLVIRYGPLQSTGKILLGNFNLFFGKNEDGKTLTIDALVKLLLGRKAKDFKDIDRVEDSPDGYIIIEDDEGKEIKLPEKGNLTEVAGLTPSECRNIFVIRNSDLSIARESEFYARVMDQLTGLRTEEISRIREALLDIGRLTPGGTFLNIGDEKLKERLKSAEDLIGEIEGLSRRVKKEEFDKLEEESVGHREELDITQQKIETLGDARKRENYKKGKGALDKLETALKELKGLEIYNEEDKQLWRDCEKGIESLAEQEEEERKSLKGKKGNLGRVVDEISSKGQTFQVLDDKKEKLDDDIKPKLKDYGELIGELVSKESQAELFASLGKISTVLLVIFSLGVLLNPSLFFYILFGLILIPTLVSWFWRFHVGRRKAQLAKMFEGIRLELSKYGLDAANVEGVLSDIQKFEDKHSEKAKELEDLRVGEKALKDAVKEIEEKKIPEIRRRIKEENNKIDELRERSGAKSLSEYSKKLGLRQRYERALGEQESSLESLFGTEGETWEEKVSYWGREIKTLEEYRDKSRDIEPDEKIVSNLKSKAKSLEEELKEMSTDIADFRREFENVERQANEILRLEADYLHCETSVDLDRVNDKLQEFIDGNENNKDSVLEAMKIFEEIEKEEKEKVSELFGKDSPVSKYFDEITDGLYEEVVFNQEAGSIEVKHKDGTTSGAEKLSGGTYDQLYLSIRLALGEKLLKGKRGLFIMDDPFVKADPDRLQRQIEVLKKIAKMGWQILYFTAKGEVKDVLEGEIKEGDINYVEVPSMYP